MIGLLRHREFRQLFLAQMVALVGTGLATVALALLATPSSSLGTVERLAFLFTAQFSLSHACWLLAYPLAAWVGSRFGLGTALIALSGVAVVGLITAARAWPASDPTRIEHRHDDLPATIPTWRRPTTSKRTGIRTSS